MTVRIRSMTGFGTSEAESQGSKFRIEVRSVNHRFLDVKIRLPRELQSLEASFRSVIQSRFNRGALELKVERTHAEETERPEMSLEVNEARARDAYQAYAHLARALGLSDSPTLRDIAAFPEVIRARNADEVDLHHQWTSTLEPATSQALSRLLEMRETEGANLTKILLESIQELRQSIHEIGRMRKSSENEFKRKISEKVETIFEAHPIQLGPSSDLHGALRTLLESRISQELSLVIDRTDIQEELHRFDGHLTHFEKTITEGGAVGRKLEFILQELGREINTLGNKAQDLGISEQVVSVKVRLEQLREQVLNLE